jgi:hypothetical protein
LVSHQRIEAGSKQIQAIIEMGPPRCIKDVQKLTGCMVALNHFISQLGKKGLPFFKLLKKDEQVRVDRGSQGGFQKP